MGCYITIRQDLERCVSVFVNHGHTFGFHRFGVHIAVGIYAEAAVGILNRFSDDRTACYRRRSNSSRRADVAVIIDMETRIIVRTANPQAVFAQRVMGTFRIAGVESVFVDHRILVSRTCHATVFASLRVVVNGLFTVFCGSRHRSRCFNQFYHRRRSFVVVNGAVQLFIIQLFERWISCLSRHSAYPCRQYQCSQYSCSAPACAARCTLRTAVGKF